MNRFDIYVENYCEECEGDHGVDYITVLEYVLRQMKDYDGKVN